MTVAIEKVNKIYLSGIGGIGLSALAYYFLESGKRVAGSDVVPSIVTKKLEDRGVEINFEQKESNIKKDIDIFIYSSALSDKHPELKKARELEIPTLSYFEFLGWLSRQYKTIAVTGTNGKTTTTAMLGLMLEKAGFDPTVIVGSIVPQWNSNFRLGKSDIFVVEACEWRAHMLELQPHIIVLANVAEDHLDFYKDLNDIKDHFQQFVDSLPGDGLFIKNIDDKNSQDIIYSGKTLTFGQDKNADYHWLNLEVTAGLQKFSIHKKDKKLTDIDLKVPGSYNIYNSVSAIAVMDYLGANKHQIWNGINEFSGTWRRFELVGQDNSNLVISDYAHHPDSIRGLLKATKDFYPSKKIVAIFQPHHHNRTKTLLKDFAKSFKLADHTIISEIYHVSGREDEILEDVSSKDLVNYMHQDEVYYAKDFNEVHQKLREVNPVDSVLLFIGAGDIDDLAREIVD